MRDDHAVQEGPDSVKTTNVQTCEIRNTFNSNLPSEKPQDRIVFQECPTFQEAWN